MKVLVSIAAMLPWFKASANACDERQRVDFGKKSFVRFSIVLDDPFDLSRLRRSVGRFGAYEARSACLETREVDLWRV